MRLCPGEHFILDVFLELTVSGVLDFHQFHCALTKLIEASGIRKGEHVQICHEHVMQWWTVVNLNHDEHMDLLEWIPVSQYM
mmetsp:Transcript_37946/g.108377  ORF Transcript_37946/g.108377 Transcript_37946/m.108377 type:complete len:82 (+) Transcript_37946:103-348(+)